MQCPGSPTEECLLFKCSYIYSSQISLESCSFSQFLEFPHSSRGTAQHRGNSCTTVWKLFPETPLLHDYVGHSVVISNTPWFPAYRGIKVSSVNTALHATTRPNSGRSTQMYYHPLHANYHCLLLVVYLVCD